MLQTSFVLNGNAYIHTMKSSIMNLCRTIFLFNSFTKDTVEVKVCPPECGKTKPCIPKCCSLDHVFSVGVKGIRGCHQLKNTTDYFNPPFYSDLTLN